MSRITLLTQCRPSLFDALVKSPEGGIFWLRDKGLEGSDDLPEPDVLAQEIADDLQTALEQFAGSAAELRG